jgi:DNA sulfur modification protein DndC
MTTANSGTDTSMFSDGGYQATIKALKTQIQELYRSDSIPWVVGYSGGKDSTATLQLVWAALSELPRDARSKPVHVISTDTLVENPIVAAWVTRSLEAMTAAADRDQLPITPHRLTPALKDSFWVNLIGRGYPAPRPKFRWCTERLKINPSNRFITSVVQENGEAILVLGTRKAESSTRAGRMQKLESIRVRDHLSPNLSLPNSLVYSPIENWSNDDVWLYLMQSANPWGYNNKDLLTMYQGASEDGECPLVVDTSTPSCGDSRFGCWVCTLVDQDRSMQAMIQNDHEKEWMAPLLALRNELDVPNDRPLRDFRRMNGTVQLFHNDPIPGPYTQHSRERWLRKVLEAQQWVRDHGPKEMGALELISDDELHEIRRLWVFEKHEIEDNLPTIYHEVTGNAFTGKSLDEHLPFTSHLQTDTNQDPVDPMAILRDVCLTHDTPESTSRPSDDETQKAGQDSLLYQLTRELLDVEQRHASQVRRKGLISDLEHTIRRHFYTDETDATERARARQRALSTPTPESSTPADESTSEEPAAELPFPNPGTPST